MERNEKPRDKLNLLSVVVSATHYAYQITLINDENCFFSFLGLPMSLVLVSG